MSLPLSELIGWAIGLLGMFTTVVGGLVKLLLHNFEKRLGERFAAQEAARKAASRHWDENFAKVLQRQDKDAQALLELERSFLRFQAELPLEYVRREDWVRGQAVLEAKLDGVALKIENIMLKGARND
ncbi:hypothetical protein CDR19_09545 [Ectopseudomonas toyotomiensis]|uniref:Uncharacterized protein n=1 Tax=Ectopseudomonas toyotomiensis TaxID=554344 RepID=A0A1I5PD03_9GAMM|nr:hypothetical protein [Pseudomonas toyotomiensis]ELL4423439.1 hypothetical protein [Pseudomonas aeruginosa]PIA73656.1 hypothetical protein CDR19_09545 [Pseudomonas toyotomiensis]SFP31972.1 hypothetical protein SAMN05216177_102257 [Pseudomonas toyotomiensis]